MNSLLLLIVGLGLLIGGADILVRSAGRLAEWLGVPPLVIGLTVVAFGTSMPELVINTLSAVHGATALAFGNIIGSALVNIGFVLAISALARPLRVQPSIIAREIPMMLLAVAAVLILSADRFLTGANQSRLSRQDGLILLLLFGMFLYYTIYQILAHRQDDVFVNEVRQGIDAASQRPWRSFLGTLAGLGGVAVGGRLAVGGAVGLAERAGIPSNVIGLTVVSLGTTLPELITGITAARKGLSDIAVGNIVGSNIFNLLLIGGVAATIRPVPLPHGGVGDLLALGGLSLILLPICIRGPRKVNRAEGIVLLALYAAYIAARLLWWHRWPT